VPQPSSLGPVRGGGGYGEGTYASGGPARPEYDERRYDDDHRYDRPGYDDRRSERPGYDPRRKKRKESWLGDLLDFG